MLATSTTATRRGIQQRAEAPARRTAATVEFMTGHELLGLEQKSCAPAPRHSSRGAVNFSTLRSHSSSVIPVPTRAISQRPKEQHAVCVFSTVRVIHPMCQPEICLGACPLPKPTLSVMCIFRLYLFIVLLYGSPPSALQSHPQRVFNAHGRLQNDPAELKRSALCRPSLAALFLPRRSIASSFDCARATSANILLPQRTKLRSARTPLMQHDIAHWCRQFLHMA